MKKYLKLLLSFAVVLLPLSCGDDNEALGDDVTVVMTSQSVAEGAEVDALSTTEIALYYNMPVQVGSAASITLNGVRVQAQRNPRNATGIVIPVQLEEGASYTLKLPAGSVVAESNRSATAPELVLNFRTYAPRGGNIAQLPLTTNSDAVRLYRYLYSQYGQKVISSVMANVNWNNECAEKVFRLTGKYPAMNCYDFIHICFSPADWIDYTKLAPVQQWVNNGGLVQLMWHFNVPKTQGSTDVTCTPSETTFRAAKVFEEGSWENQWFYTQMDKVVATLLKLQEAGIAATWRPFHEAAGNATAKQQADWTKSWFWWGYDGAETYKRLWTTMYDYFQQKGVRNLIWVWTTQNYNGNSAQYSQDTAWYPGDQYVDIVARDLYGYTAEQNAQEFNEIQAAYPNKMVVLGECGQGDGHQPGRIGDGWTKGAKWGLFMVWYQGGEGSTDTMCSDDWWRDAMQDANVITRDQIKM
ncbi:MAG: hypothetical protein IJV45_02710 [Prevotella sp.]|nr:hypothetical protein [Prevotella sp.]